MKMKVSIVVGLVILSLWAFMYGQSDCTSTLYNDGTVSSFSRDVVGITASTLHSANNRSWVIIWNDHPR